MNPRQTAPPGARFRFEEFELDARSLELWRDGELVSLRPRPAQVLAALAEAAPEMLTHEDLHRLVWGENLHVQLEQSLKSCIKQIRDALGDDAKRPRFVETLPRRGYRFVAPVQVVPATVGGPLSLARRRLERVAGAALVLLALAGVGYVTVEALDAREPARTAEPHPSGRARGERPPDSPAYEVWFQAQTVLVPGAPASEVERAVRLLRLAESLDPSFAPAPASLALAYTRLTALPASVRYPAALRAAEHALRLQPRSAAARLARGLVRFYYQLDWPGAREDFEAAIAAAPQSVDAHLALAGWFAARGQHERVQQLIDAARELDPASSYTSLACGWNLYYARDFEGSLRECKRALRLRGPTEENIRCVVLAGLAARDVRAAAAAARLALAGPVAGPSSPRAPADDVAPAELSDRQAIDRYLERWLDRLALQAPLMETAGDRFLPLLLLGRRDEAVAALVQAVQSRSAAYVPYLQVAPFLDPLRGDPRVQRLIDQVTDAGAAEASESGAAGRPGSAASEKP